MSATSATTEAPPPPPRVLIIGTHGAGKTSLGRSLAQALGLPHASVGEVTRAAHARGVLPRDGGAHFSRDEAAAMLAAALPEQGGCVMDGYPPTPDAAGGRWSVALHLQLSDETAAARIAARAERALDGDAAAARERLANWHARCASVLDALHAAGVRVVNIDAEARADDVLRAARLACGACAVA